KPAIAAASIPLLDKKKILSAVVQLSCKSQLGAGFFFEADRVLTNAHVVCDDASVLNVHQSDGKSFIGRVLKRDEWLDYAIVEVGGANALSPFKLGDSTTLTEGEPVVLVGSPQGLSFTWHEGKVSYL